MIIDRTSDNCGGDNSCPLGKTGEEGKQVSKKHIFVGPESDHIADPCHSLTPWRLIDLIDVTLTCKDANSKLFDVVTVADVDTEIRIDDSFDQDLWNNFRYDLKKLLWYAELNPRVRCVFGNVS